MRKAISVCGVVQGVGFRPFVYRLAHECGLAGWVLNHSGGVEIEVEGPPAALETFIRDLEAKAPPLARIEGIEVAGVPPVGGTTFEIRRSVAAEGRYPLISPDIATCPDCLRELLDPADRRYRYPFTNCTNCGPRFTIIADVPYDRPLTTMRDFVMCPQCQAEYDDPLDRRFHAQPNACPVCGPHVWLADAAGHPPPPYRGGVGGGDEAHADHAGVLAQARDLLLAGKILAIKGLGGFHLACDATGEAAVRTLRERKGRPAKPLAVMMATLDQVQQHCWVSEEEERLLTSSQCSIVLLPWKPESDVCRLVAPRNHYLGVMLPYTPLHHVLLRDVGRPLVMTSGNLSEEPIARDNAEALRRLAHLADVFLLHNRDIYARYDDSVWFVPHVSRFTFHVSRPAPQLQTALPQPIRRARGYAPFPVKLPFRVGPILACGAELKNTFCLTRDEYAFLSQHIGDMENLETLEHFEATIELYKRLFRLEPAIIAHDLHPDYLATRYAKSQIANQQISKSANLQSPISNLQPPTSNLQLLVPVQHHHAHVASCLADNGWPPDAGPVIGVAWDGTGYGAGGVHPGDGHIWGGEFLVAGYHGFRRAAHLEYLPMPGGEAAIRNPYRLAIGYLYALTGQLPSFIASASEEELRIIQQQVDQRINCPQTSAGGRLFDAVSALLGICERITYEGQAAIELEMAALNPQWQMANGKSQIATSNLHSPFSILHPPSSDTTYPFDVESGHDRLVIRLRPLFEALLADRQSGTAVEEIAYRFHLTVAEIIGAVCERIAQETGLRTVALSGGCFQNRLLLALAVPRLEAAGLEVLLHRQVPCNDGGISLGQAVIAHFTVEQGSK
ncbi:MAG TPA: carbamoyltransferase HypF [Anaerolineae bacterium]|nr:carbamoyltransferase HypF [Anaerolineae bacterium]